MKKYLNTIEDIEALRNTDTKIYKDNATGYYKFVNGVLCFFNTDSAYAFYNVTLDFNQVESKLYIEVDEQDYIGKLGVFWDDDGDADDGEIDMLEEIGDKYSYRYFARYEDCSYQHFRPLTPEEVEEYTGYKVVKED